jgi:flagellin-like protein
MKRMMRSRKGVSPVIAAMLMIVVAIIGMSFLFAFAVNYATDFQLGKGSAVLESMVIEYVYWDGVSDDVDIWVYNVGKTGLKINNVFVNDVQTLITYLEDVPVAELNSPVEVGVGEHIKFSVQSDPLSEGINLFRLVTARGSAFEERY